MHEIERTRTRLRVDAFDRYARSRGLITLTDRARAIGVQPSTLGRVLSGEIRAGERVISGALAYFGVPFEALFELETEGKAS